MRIPRFPSGRLFLSLALCVGVAACGSIPLPFRHGPEARTNPLLELDGGRGVVVLPVRGVQPKMGLRLAQAMAEALKQREIPAVAAPVGNGVNYTLSGNIAETSQKGTAVRLSLAWILNSGDGTLAGEFRHEMTVDRVLWNDMSPRAIDLVTAMAMPRVAAYIQENVPAQPVVAAAAPGAVFIKPVSGAPGDGNAALGHAMIRALGGVGTSLTDDVGKADFVLEGAVDMGKPADGRQPVGIVWRVLARDGTEVGRTSQNNAVPAGSLDGSWGNTALVATAAVVDAVGQILKEGTTRFPGGIAKAVSPMAASAALAVPPSDGAEVKDRIAEALPVPTRAAEQAVPQARRRLVSRTPAAAPRARSAASAAEAAYQVQLASLRAEEQVTREWMRLRDAHSDLLGTLDLDVTRVDLGRGRGVFYRLRAGPLPGRPASLDLCQQLQARSIDCFVVRHP